MTDTNYVGTASNSLKTTMLEMEAVKTVAKTAQETVNL